MATPSRTVSYDSILSSCLQAFLGKDPVDNIFKDHVLLEVLKQKGCLQAINGGESIKVPLEISTNSTVGSFTNYDVIDTTPQDPFTTAYYTWRQLAASIAISGLEEIQNRGEHAIFNLLKAKTANTLASMREELNLQLMGKTYDSGTAYLTAGAGPTASATETDFDPIGRLLTKDPTSSRTVGNVNPNTETWWQAYSRDGNGSAGHNNNAGGVDVTTWAQLLDGLNALYHYCSRGGGGRPDFIITSQVGFEQVETALRDKVRYMQTGEGSVAFDNLQFKAGCPMYWDEMMPDPETGVIYSSGSYALENYYMLNSKFMKLIYDSQHNFTPTPFVRPENQDAKTAQMLFVGNLCWSNARKHGLFHGIPATPMTS